MAQAGAVSAAHIEQLLDTAAAFCFLPPAYRSHVGVAGAGGGWSVMAADLCEEAGLNVIPLPDAIRQALQKADNPVWDWVTNPVDFSIAVELVPAFITKMMAENPDFDLNIVFLDPQRNRGALSSDVILNEFPWSDLQKKPLFVVLLDWGKTAAGTDLAGSELYRDLKNKLIGMGIPAYPTAARATNAAGKMINFYINQKKNMAG